MYIKEVNVSVPEWVTNSHTIYDGSFKDMFDADEPRCGCL